MDFLARSRFQRSPFRSFMTHQLYNPRHFACMNSRASASRSLTSILIFLHSNMVHPRTTESSSSLLAARGRSGALSLAPHHRFPLPETCTPRRVVAYSYTAHQITCASRSRDACGMTCLPEAQL